MFDEEKEVPVLPIENGRGRYAPFSDKKFQLLKSLM